jgi:hypothetical protein
MAAEAFAIADRIRDKKAPPQHLRDVLFQHRLHALFALAAEDRIEVARKFLAQGVALARVGGEQRRNHGAPIHFGPRLGQILEEVQQPTLPRRVFPYFFARVHSSLGL